MDINNDVIADLLPVYYSGEASAATKRLVEEFLARDPVFAERARRDWAESAGSLTTGAASPAARAGMSVELRSLQRTKRMLTSQRWLFGVAFTCTLLPASCVISFHDGQLTDFHFLMRDYPGVFVPIGVAAVACWIVYSRLKRTLNV